MDEEKQKEETIEGKPEEQAKPAENAGERVLPQTTPLIDVANASAERMEKANIETAKLLDRQEALEQRRALGGRAEAGQTPAEKPEITDAEYAEALERGEVNPLKEDGYI